MSTSYLCDKRLAEPVAKALHEGKIRPSIGVVLAQMRKRDQVLFMEDAQRMTLNAFEDLTKGLPRNKETQDFLDGIKEEEILIPVPGLLTPTHIVGTLTEEKKRKKL